MNRRLIFGATLALLMAPAAFAQSDSSSGGLQGAQSAHVNLNAAHTGMVHGHAQNSLGQPIVMDYRPGAGIRVAPHFYTSDDELERVVDMIDGILRDGSWKPFEAQRGTVT